MTVLLGAWLAVAGGGTAVAGPMRSDPDATTTSTTTTTTVAAAGDTSATTSTTSTTNPTSTPSLTVGTTTTRVAPATLAPTTTQAPTTTLAPTTTSTTLDPEQLASLIQGLDADVAQAQAVSDFLAARALAAQLGTGEPLPAGADPVLVEAATTQLRAITALNAARQRYHVARQKVASVAVALYVGEQDTPAGPLEPDPMDRSFYLSDIVYGAQHEAQQANQALARANAAFMASQQEAEQLIQARSLELQATALRASAAANAIAGASASAGSSVNTTGEQSLLDQESPSILGPSLLSADELVGWYTASGRQAHLTVPLATLAAVFESIGAADGVRADIAFAQSVLETDYFGFPSFGQVAVTDNNFAGIGACDSCATGESFPDPVTGVTAQMQLLHAYATTTQSVPGPLPGPFSVAGCCPTWMDLSGVWATATDYGVNILKLYQSMVLWALSHRTAAARLSGHKS